MDNLENKIIEATIIEDPFPHIIVDNFFSDDYYLEIMEEIPKCKFLGCKFQRRFTNKYTSILDRKSSSFFDNLFVYIEDKMGELLIRKFNIENQNYSTAVFLRKHTSNYKIVPHPDARFKLVTWIIYLPTEGIDEKAGTYICTPKEGVEVEGCRQPWSKFDLELVKCRSNRLFAFPVSSNLWHVVDMKGKNDGRIILKGFVFDTTMWELKI